MINVSTSDSSSAHCSSIKYRPVQPSDLQLLEQLHAELFPVRYDTQFFHSVVNGHGILAWVAVDSSRPGNQSNEIIGFATARIMSAKESKIKGLVRYDYLRRDHTLAYILTLGVVEQYHNMGIATALVRLVLKHASSISNCKAVYLHVIAYNLPAIHFYKKMLFKVVSKLSMFYYINGQRHDSFLFVYYVNDGQPPYSPLDIISSVAAYFRGLLTSLYAKVRRKEKISTVVHV